MNRRRVLRWLASGGAVGLSGCALLRPGEQRSVRPTPERPERPGDEALVDYVGDHAETTVANRMIRDRRASTVSVDCRAVVVKRTDTGVYLVTERDGSAQFDDRSGSFTTTLFYAVTDSATVPVGNEQVRDTEVYESSEESENLDKTSGIGISNFDGTERTFRWPVVEEPAWAGLWIAITPDGRLIACGAADSECATPYPLSPESDTLTARDPL